MRAALAALILCCLTPAIGWTQVVSPRADRVAVVIYPETFETPETPPDYPLYPTHYGEDADGLALVSEERAVDLPAGASVLRFEGVAEGIVPQTATVSGLPAAIDEQNFDYSLITPATLIGQSVGRSVRLVRTNPATGEEVSRPAIIRAGPNGVVLEVEGRIEALHCSGSLERIVFDTLPPGLVSRPTLSARVTVARAGRYVVRLTYLTTGLHWRADYVARLRPDGRADLSGWITLTNDTSTTFDNVPVQVVAGVLTRSYETVAEPIVTPQQATNCTPPPRPRPQPPGEAMDIEGVIVTGSYIAATVENVAIAVSVVGAGREDLGDYKLYTLPEPTTVAAHQTKQVSLVSDRAVSFQRIYVFSVRPERYYEETETAPAAIYLHTRNLESNGLGLPLPGGSVSWLEQTTTGRTVFAGEAQIGNTAAGLPIWLGLGQAQDLDVTVTPLPLPARGPNDPERVRLRYSVTNNKPVPVTFQFTQVPTADYRLIGRYPRPRLEDGLRFWRRELAPGETFTLTLTSEYVRAPEED